MQLRVKNLHRTWKRKDEAHKARIKEQIAQSKKKR